MSEAANLSGLWHGQYAYPRDRDPVHFLATLTEADSWLAGTTEEIAAVGAARGRTLTATLQGRRTGRTVTFLKLYDGAERHYDAVQYAGEVNDDSTEIHGTWTITGQWSGPFLMIRAGAEAIQLAKTAAERV